MHHGQGMHPFASMEPVFRQLPGWPKFAYRKTTRLTMMSSKTLRRTLGVFLIFLLEPLLAGMSIPVAVNVRDTAVLSCNSTCKGEVLWTFKANSKNLEVLKCVQGLCTEGDGFKGRASLSSENMSLTIHPALYNDEGWYEAHCGSDIPCIIHLEVFVSRAVNASVRDNVTLHCYARTEKRIVDEDVNILWKREEQMVLEVKNGIVNYGSGFTQRASVSVNHYKDGDLSLTVSRVTPSDSGIYRCYHKTEELGHPGAVQLTVTAHQSHHEKKVGDDLTLDLFILDNVTVTFTDSEGVEVPVCRVEGSTSTCTPKYHHRVSVINDSLVLSELSSSDNGKFTLKDNMDKILSVCTVTVKDLPQRRNFNVTAVIVASVIVASVIVSLILCMVWCQYKKSQKHQRHTSTVDMEMAPLREPARIGLSQEETGHNSEELNIPHTPVEETSPGTVITSEKQEILLEENDCLLLENE